MFPVYITVLCVIAGIILMAAKKMRFATAFLLAFLVCGVGFGSIFAFMGHFFVPDKVAAGIGWPAGNPFQQEVAFANLGIGLLGILCAWFRGNFWLATIIMNAAFLTGAGTVHLKEILAKGNMNYLNAGPVFFGDFIGPVILIVLYVAKKYTDPEK